MFLENIDFEAESTNELNSSISKQSTGCPSQQLNIWTVYFPTRIDGNMETVHLKTEIAHEL